jgi:hypothetical protein
VTARVCARQVRRTHRLDVAAAAGARTGKNDTYRNDYLSGVRQWIESVNQTLKGQLDRNTALAPSLECAEPRGFPVRAGVSGCQGCLAARGISACWERFVCITLTHHGSAAQRGPSYLSADNRPVVDVLLDEAGAAQRTGARSDYEPPFGSDQVLMQTVDVEIVTENDGAALTTGRQMPPDTDLPVAARARHLLTSPSPQAADSDPQPQRFLTT